MPLVCGSDLRSLFIAGCYVQPAPVSAGRYLTAVRGSTARRELRDSPGSANVPVGGFTRAGRSPARSSVQAPAVGRVPGSGAASIFADVDDMPGELSSRVLRSERRVAMMAVVKAAWTGPGGEEYESPAKLEDTSRSGACIRVSAPIAIDTRLIIDCRKERFSGVARYCRADGGEYCIGIRRDFPEGATAAPSAARVEPPAETASAGAGAVVPDRGSGGAVLSGSSWARSAAGPRLREAARDQPISLIRDPVEPMPSEQQSSGIATKIIPQKSEARSVVPFPSPQPKKLEVSRRQERTNMFSKFFSAKQEAKSNANGAPSNGGSNGASSPSYDAPLAARTNDARPRVSRQEPGTPQGNYLPLEDIYRAAGLIDLRTGYSIQKVVEMLNSSHIRNLSDDMRRASVLMALDAVGIAVENILRDARLRLEVLSKYESEQMKRFQEFEAQKLKENAAIQAELEQVTEHYRARMKNNLDEVTQLRDPFVGWQSTKQEEVRQVSEAVALCSKRAESAGAAPLQLGPVAVPAPVVALVPVNAAPSPQPALKP
jgi:hypothetical protein